MKAILVRACVGWAALCFAGCASQASEEEPPLEAPESAPGELLTASMDVQVDGPCDPMTDGWKPEPIVLTAEQQAAIDRGEEVDTIPPGYVDKAPSGVPFCETGTEYDPGKYTGHDVHFWTIRCNGDEHCTAATACPVDNANSTCSILCSRDDECSWGKVCRSYGDKGLSVCMCGPPDWCGHSLQ